MQSSRRCPHMMHTCMYASLFTDSVNAPGEVARVIMISWRHFKDLERARPGSRFTTSTTSLVLRQWRIRGRDSEAGKPGSRAIVWRCGWPSRVSRNIHVTFMYACTERRRRRHVSSNAREISPSSGESRVLDLWSTRGKIASIRCLIGSPPLVSWYAQGNLPIVSKYR